MKAAFAAIALAVNLVAGDVHAGGWGAIFRSSDDVARGLSHSSDDILHGSRGVLARELGLSDDALRGMNRSHVDDFEVALLDYQLRGDLALLRQAVAEVRKEAGEIHRTIAFSGDLPSIRLRAPASAKFDGSIQLFAQLRLQRTMNEPFDVRDLRVVTLGMADTPAASAREAQRFARGLPHSARDSVGPLSSMQGGLKQADMVAMLEPYRGTTVVVIGHIRNGEMTFFKFLPNGNTEVVALKEWAEAARDAGVNLIPIGCNSGRFAEFGADSLVNSADALARLRDVMRLEPRSLGTFFKHLTGDDLQIVIDPLTATLFTNGAEIVKRQSNQLVGRIGLEGVRSGGRLLWNTSRPSTAPHYATCFSQSTGDEFERCAGQVRTRLELEDADRYREKRLRDVPGELTLARTEHAERLGMLIGASAIYVFVWIICGLLIPYSVIVFNTARELDESEVRVFFRRDVIQGGLLVIWNSIRRFFPDAWNGLKFCFTEDSARGKGELAFLALLLPLLFGALVFAVPAVAELGIWLLIFAVYAGWQCVFLLWEAFREKSISLVVTPLAFAIMVGAAVLFLDTFEPLEYAKDSVERLERELAELN